MYNNKKCANYFKKNAAYERCFLELRKKWESYGRTAGRITLKNASQEEQRAIGSIIGKIFLEKDITFTFAEFEQGLQKTRFAPIHMKKVLELYFGEEILTNQEKRSLIKNEKAILVNHVCMQLQDRGMNFSCQISEDFAHEDIVLTECTASHYKKEMTADATPSYLYRKKTSVAVLWLQAMIEEKKYGYSIFAKEFSESQKKTEMLMLHIGNAILRLEMMGGQNSPLAVFSAEISGNPHFFDRGSVASQLLLHGICFWKNCNIPTTAYDWRQLMWSVGIVCDNIASSVHAFCVHLETVEGWHPAYEAFCHRKEPCVITSENLRYVIRAKAANHKVYIVENEMVFSYLAEQLKFASTEHREVGNILESQEITLLCTSGQLRVAAFQLLTLLIESKATIYYSGDLDPEGIVIAEQLWKKYGDMVQMWRMTPEDYKVGISNEPLNEMRLAKLSDVKHPILRQSADCILERKYAAYQENLLECLLEDLIKI